jgi:hypothetical protein
MNPLLISLITLAAEPSATNVGVGDPSSTAVVDRPACANGWRPGDPDPMRPGRL